MADTKPENDTTDTTKAQKSAKGGVMNKLLLVVVLLLGAAAGYVVKGSTGGAADATTSGPTTTAPPEPGAMVSIAPLSVNLADDHYLKIGVAVQLVDGALDGVEAHGSDSPADAWLDENGPVIRDLLISELGGSHVAEFANAGGRESLRRQLLDKANEHLEGTVYALYFTEFVMQ